MIRLRVTTPRSAVAISTAARLLAAIARTAAVDAGPGGALHAVPVRRRIRWRVLPAVRRAVSVLFPARIGQGRGCARGPRRPALPRHRAAAAALLLALAAAPAAAQTLSMRSGEHATFTRLTLPLLPGQSWQLGRTVDGYGLRLPGNTAVLDASGVFARIPRSRLAALRPVSGGIDMVLACDCHAIGFEEGSLLVIDLRDGPPPPGARFEARLAGPVRQIAAPPRSGFDWTRRFVVSAPGATAAADDATARMPEGASPALPTAVPRATAMDEVSAAAVARGVLVRQFARAAAQGLVGSDLPDATPLGTPGPGRSAVDAGAVTHASGGAIDPSRNLIINAETAVDRARRGLLLPGLMPDGDACLPDALFALGDWGDGALPAAQIARHRAALLGEFDAPDAAAVGRLARLYLHFGFGAEARALLAALPVALPEAVVLMDLAALIDEALPQPQAGFAGMEGCNGPVALWAVLAVPDLSDGRPIDRAAVLRAFSALPLSLRRHLGPPLAQRFLAIGDSDTARQVRNAISRASGDHGSGLELLEAGLELAQGRPEAASATLAPVVAGNAPDAAEALAVMVEARLAAGLPIDAATADSVVVMARERRGTPLGVRLTRLEALGLASTGRFDAAFAVRDRLARGGSGRRAAAEEDGAAAAALEIELLVLLAERADDVELLTRVFAEDAWRAGALPPASRRMLAERLLATGFPEAAREALPPADTAAPEDIALAARAALALGEARDALRLIAGQAGSEAAILRGEALAKLGEYVAATQAFLDGDAPDEAARAAWLGGDWTRLAVLGDGAAAELAAQRTALVPPTGEIIDPGADDPDAPGAPAAEGPAVEAPLAGDPGSAPDPGAGPARGPATPLAAAPAIPDSDGALARSRALLSTSAEARDLAAALLEQKSLPTR